MTNMIEFRGSATLIAVALLSCNSFTGIQKSEPDKDGDDAVRIDQGKILDNMLCGASLALTIYFTANFTIPESSEISPAPDSRDDEASCMQADPAEHANEEFEETLSGITIQVDGSDEHVCINELPVVENNDVTQSWMKRARSSHVRKPNNVHQLLRRLSSIPEFCPLLQTSQEFCVVPAMMPCDSFVSPLSRDCSISSISSKDIFSMSSMKNYGSMSSQANAEWASIE